jgi:O-acetyl-ADP-ribose deacetylase (regulator of RNase III)
VSDRGRAGALLEGRLRVETGDITRQKVDVIVNAANSGLMGGGGVDGAIHRAGGPAILSACRMVRQEKYPDGLPAGQAVQTTAGRLAARFVIHTVGPVWHGGGRGEPELLASCYRRSLELAAGQRLRSVAFPSISTGVYGYPVAEAAPVALGTVARFLLERADAPDEVRFVLFDGGTFAAYRAALEALAV